MWIRKTEEKLRKGKENFKVSYVAPIGMFIGALIIQSFRHLTGVSRFSRRKPLSIEEYFHLLPEILIISVILSVAIYFAQILLKKNFLLETGETTVICDKCHKIKTDDKKYDCSCGGKYIKINEMEWIDDETERKTTKI